MSLRLVATDLDGTFLDGEFRLGTSPVSPTNERALSVAADAGVTVLVATGRPHRWLRSLVPFLQRQPLAIVSNGAAIVDIRTGRPEIAWPVESALAVEALGDLRRELPDVRFAVEWGDLIGAEPGFAASAKEEMLTASLEQLFDHRPDPLKLLVTHVGVPTDALAARVEPILAGRLTTTFSFLRDDGLLELSAPGVSKAHALATWCDQHGIAAADTVAFGDMPNDLAMLAWAGQGYAMPGAHPSLPASGFPVLDGPQGTAVGRTVLGLLGARVE